MTGRGAYACIVPAKLRPSQTMVLGVQTQYFMDRTHHI